MVDRGLVASRERAQAMILAGKVLVDEQKIEKAGAQIDEASSIRLLGEDLKYVSRGGLKLERALDHWNIDVDGKSCVDVGASTGGFTDCLLQHGAARVIARREMPRPRQGTPGRKDSGENPEPLCRWS